ncbi:MAG: glycosyltransferase [Desulfobacca sp.]|uniref:glycosyltransferase n=1 Tax=Desulfobacca sp. TaxID=2067990 RepID=UPI004049D840
MAEQSDGKIKVALALFDADYVTSTHKIVDLLASQLPRERFVPCVICFLPTQKQAWAADIPLYCLNSYRRAAMLAAGRLARLVQRLGIQVVVSSNTGPNLATAAAKLLAGSQFKAILIEHNTFSLHEGKKPSKRWLAGKLYAQADQVVGVSQGVSRDLISLFPGLAPITTTIYNCLLTPQARLQELAHEEVDHPWFAAKDRPIFLNVAELFPRKGQDTLIRAFALVRQKVPARLVLVGTLREPTYGAVQSLAKDLGVAADIAFLGYQANPFKYMHRADAFVLSSREEGFGLVLVEAMACGCPVIATNCPYGPDEIIVPEQSGLLVPVDDPAAMAGAMLRILKEEGLADRCRRGGLVRQHLFAPQSFLQHYEQIIQQVVLPCKPKMPAMALTP